MGGILDLEFISMGCEIILGFRAFVRILLAENLYKGGIKAR